MHLTITRTVLKRALDRVQFTVAKKPVRAALADVELTATTQGLFLRTTVLDAATQQHVAAEVADADCCTVSFRALRDVVKTMSGDVVTITGTRGRSDRTLTVTDGGNTTTMPQGDLLAFPTDLAFFPTGVQVYTTTAAFRRLARVAMAAAPELSRPVLEGMLFRITRDQLIGVAADGHRLALETTPLLFPATVDTAEWIVPAPFVRALATCVKTGDVPLSIVFHPETGQVVASTTDTRWVSQCIDGTFPNYERIIPEHPTRQVVIERAAILRSLNQAAAVAPACNAVKLTVDTDGTVTIAAHEGTRGVHRSTIAGRGHGAAVTTACNVTYLCDALHAVDAAQLELRLSSAQTPVVLRPVGETGQLHLIMPMQLKGAA